MTSEVGTKIIIFGAGNFGRIVASVIEPNNIAYFVDNDSLKWGSHLEGYPIHGPHTLEQEEKDQIEIIIASQYYKEITYQLDTMGFVSGIHYLDGTIIDGVQEKLEELIIEGWINKGKPVPPPHLIKQRTVKAFAKTYNIKVLIETGTYKGDMIQAVKNDFEQIHSIELSVELYNNAKNKFRKDENISIHHGDSSVVLERILPNLKMPCLYWLDAHYSGGGTAKGSVDTPILRELDIIYKSNTYKPVILIDDARLFNGTNDYPTLEELCSFIKVRTESTKIELEDDIIRIY